MKRLLKTTSLFALIAITGSAFAQQSPTDPANFTPRLKLQSRYSLWDTYRKNEMDLLTATARFGMNYRYKNVFGTIEAQAGSPSDTYTSTTTASSTTATNSSTTNGSQSLFNVRRAVIGLDLYTSDPATVTFSLGRDRIVSSLVYAPDALTQNLATNLDNVSSLTSSDGITLKYAGKLEFGKVAAGVGSYNNLAVATQSTGASWFGNSSVVSSDNSFNGAPKTQSRAIQAYVSADVNAGDGVVEARVGYGTQANAVTRVETVNSVTTYTSRDVRNIEASAGYNYMGSVKAGVWYQTVTLGKTQTATSAAKNDLSYTASATDDSQTINTVGVGFTGNSKLWGMSGLIADGDVLTYALGYQNATGQLVSGGGGTTGVTAFTNATLTTDIYNVGVGYQQGNFSLEFNYAGINASQQIYPDNDAVLSQSAASIFYLVGTVSL